MAFPSQMPFEENVDAVASLGPEFSRVPMIVAESSLETALPTAASSGASSNAQSGCPPPIAWQEVRAAVRQESGRYDVRAEGIALTAATLGGGPPLYLLPGFLGDHELSILTAWLLKEEFACVMLDPPMISTGEVRSPADALRDTATAVMMLADRLGHERIRLHGPNFGSMMALQILLDYPDRVECASLQSGFAHWRLSPFERLLIALAGQSRRGFGEIPGTMRVQIQNHRRWFPQFDQTRWQFYAENVSRLPVAACAERARIAAAVDLRTELPHIDAPVLLTTGEGDPLMDAYASELASGLRHVDHKVFDNCGRLQHVTHPHRLVKQLRDFWEGAR